MFPDEDTIGPRCRGPVFQTGCCRSEFSSTAFDELSPMTVDPFLKHSTDQLVLFLQPLSPICCGGLLRQFSWTTCNIIPPSSL